MQKIFVDSENRATLPCPECERSRTIDAAPFLALSRAVRLRITCPCGHQGAAVLERRRHFRKPVHFRGTYRKTGKASAPGGGAMSVLDLSRTGVRLRVHHSSALEVGDRLIVQFQLDDAKRSAIRKEGVVRRIKGSELGAEFTPWDPADPNAKAIGFYLFAA